MKNWVLSISSLIFCVVVIEGGLRLHDAYLNHKYPPMKSDEALLWEHHPVLGWSKGPNLQTNFVQKDDRINVEVKTNAKGLRDKAYDYQKKENVNRILLLGDSVTVGLEVDKEHIIDAQLERLLSQQGQYEVINAATRGYGTDQCYLYFRNEGHKYAPDIVIYIFVGNDPENNVTIHRPYRKFGKPYFVIDKEGKLVLQGVPVPEIFIPHKKWLMSDKDVELCYNQVLEKAKQELKQRSLASNSRIKRILSKSFLYRFVADRIEGKLGQDEFLETPQDKPDFVVEYEWRITQRLIKKMAQLAEDIGAGFLVYEFTSLGSKEPEPTELKVGCDKLEVNYLNSFEEFYDLAQGKRIFCFPKNTHWNAKGHKFAAEKIYQHLLEQNWVSGH